MTRLQALLLGCWVNLIVAAPLEAHFKIPAKPVRWLILETEHFRIHYPDGNYALGMAAARFSEAAYTRLRYTFQYEPDELIPVFLYPSRQDFAAGNILPFPIDEATGGFTDFFHRRVVVPFHGDYRALEHVLSHEIVHAFALNLLEANYGRYPLWLMEGMAELLSPYSQDTLHEFMRPLVVAGELPPLVALFSGRVPVYYHYKMGQSFLTFFTERYGTLRLAHLLLELKAGRSLSQAFFHLTGESISSLQKQYDLYLRDLYAIELAAWKRADQAARVVKAKDRLHLSPAISPDGRTMAYLTLIGVTPVLAISDIPGPGREERHVRRLRLKLRAMHSGRYEEWQPLSTRISFRPDGQMLLLSGRSYGQQSLLFVDIRKKRISESRPVSLDAIHYPAYTPEGQAVILTGVAASRADLYLYDLKKETLSRLTDSLCYEKDPLYFRGDLYFVAACDSGYQALYRLAGPDREPIKVTDLPFGVESPAATARGLIVRATGRGAGNLFLIPADILQSTVRLKDLETITARPGNVRSFASHETSGILWVEADGVQETIHYRPDLPQESTPLLSAVPEVRTAPAQSVAVSAPEVYRPFLHTEGPPFLILTGGSSGSGKVNWALLGFASLADFTGDHRVQFFTSYFAADEGLAKVNSRNLDLDVRYSFTPYRMDLYAGVFRKSGTFAVLNPLDLSLNEVLYNPFFRMAAQEGAGLYAGLEYPLHRFAALGLVYDQGRLEQKFLPPLPEERKQDDVLQNYQQLSLEYRFSSAVHSIYGPLDGQSFFVSFSEPLRFSAMDRRLSQFLLEYRFYHLFSDFSLFAFRAFVGRRSGADSDLYPFRLGGYATLRGYRFLELEGRNAFLLNLEYRFAFIEYLQLGFPLRLSLRGIRGVLFADAGSAFDDLESFQGFSRKYGVTRDLYLSYGVGIHWPNFLFPFLPGAVMKVEWATPFDGKRSLPPGKWRGQFSLGFIF